MTLTAGSAHADHAPTTRRGTIDGLPELRLPVLLLVGVLLLRTVLLLAADAVIVPIARATGTSLGAASLWLNVVIVGVDVITLLVLAAVLRRRGARLRDALGPIRLGRDLLLALPITIGLAVAFLAATFLANLAVYGGAPPAGPTVSVPLWLAIWSITVMPVTVALAEETLYRGVALQGLAERTRLPIAVLVSSLCFGLQHAALSPGSTSEMIARVLATFVLGVLFAVLALRLRRLLPLVIAHWVIDVLGLGLPLLILALR